MINKLTIPRLTMLVPMLPSGRHRRVVDRSWCTVPRGASAPLKPRRPIVTQETTPPSMRPYGRQILICEHGDCAPPEAAQRLAAHFRTLARGHGLTTLRNPQRVKCTLSGCLGVCAGGPILVVYPDGTWYHHVDEALLQRIITEHLLADQPVEAHIFHRLGAECVGPPAADAPVYAPDHSGDADDTEQAPAGTQLGSTPEAIARRLAARAARTQKGLLIVYT